MSLTVRLELQPINYFQFSGCNSSLPVKLICIRINWNLLFQFTCSRIFLTLATFGKCLSKNGRWTMIKYSCIIMSSFLGHFLVWLRGLFLVLLPAIGAGGGTAFFWNVQVTILNFSCCSLQIFLCHLTDISIYIGILQKLL